MEAAEFNRIARKYTDVVFRATLSYCKNKNDAEDAVQNTFLKLLKSDTQFDDDEHIRKWLIRSAKKKNKNMWKSFWHKNVTSIDELNEEPSYIESEKQELFSEVMKLPKKYSTVLHLYYYEKYSCKEIADILKISESGVQSRLLRARNTLKETLKEAWL